MSPAADTRYLLDSNVFIQAKNGFYSFDLVPGFWTTLITRHASDEILSIDLVKGELLRGNDDLAEWVKDGTPDTFFVPTDDERVFRAYREIMTWVNGERQYRDEAKAQFARGADGWLIAYAQANGLLVVTEEQLNRESKKKLPIPNVCKQFHVEYVNTVEMLRALRVKFS